MQFNEETIDEFMAGGWRPEIFSVIHGYCKRYNVEAQYLGWGFLVEKLFIVYKGAEIQDIHDAFTACFVTGFNRRPTVAFADGSGTKDKICGIGVAIYTAGSQPLYIAENIGVATNNIAELKAVWKVLKAFPDLGQKIMIRTDSDYVIGMLTRGHNASANVELVAAIKEDLSLRHGKIRFDHVDGHSGVEGNECADALANMGRKLVKTVSP